MDPQAKREMPLRAAVYVEDVGVRELTRIAVRRGIARQHDRIFRELDAAEHGVVAKLAKEELNRRAVAQHLFDDSRHEGGISTDSA